jgi:hypothetical protein
MILIYNLQGTAGEVFLAVRRFLPDFKDLQGNAKVTLAVKRYPQQSETTTTLSPFTINSSTLIKKILELEEGL